MRRCAASATLGLALLFFAGKSFAQGGVQLRWQAPANCPQEAQVRQKLRDLLGASAGDVAASRLRAEGQIEALGERFRLTLNIHYDLVNGTRVVHASSCEDLGGVAAVTLALLFRAEHSSGTPLTARDLGGAANVGAEARAVGSENQRAGAADGSTDEHDRSTAAHDQSADAERASAKAATAHTLKDSEQQPTSESDAGHSPSRLRFLFRAPELRMDVGVLPDASVGIGLGAGVRYDAWRFALSGAWWLQQDYESGEFVGYGAHFARLSGELSACRSFPLSVFELAPCALLTLDDVSARGTGVGVTSTNPRIAWLSVGVGLQGLWSLGRHAAVVFGLNGRIATSRPRFVNESVGEIAQVGPAALGVVLGLEWLL